MVHQEEVVEEEVVEEEVVEEEEVVVEEEEEEVVGGAAAEEEEEDQRLKGGGVKGKKNEPLWVSPGYCVTSFDLFSKLQTYYLALTWLRQKYRHRRSLKGGGQGKI